MTSSRADLRPNDAVERADHQVAMDVGRAGGGRAASPPARDHHRGQPRHYRGDDDQGRRADRADQQESVSALSRMTISTPHRRRKRPTSPTSSGAA